MRSLPSRIWQISQTIAIGAALGQAVLFFIIAFSRISYPFTLEWMESGSFIEVKRILSGNQLYVRPSFEFVPQIYPPLYFYISALAARLLGMNFAPLRLVSIASTAGTLALLFLIVRRRSGSLLAGILAAGFYCSTYQLSGFWLDVARVDSLALFLLLLAVYLYLQGTVSASVVGGITLALSFFTKQTMVIAGGAILIYMLLPPRRNGLYFLGTTVMVFIAGTLLLDQIHQGWYLYYNIQLPSGHNVFPGLPKIVASIDQVLYSEMFKKVPLALAVSLVYLFWFIGRDEAQTSSRQPDIGKHNFVQAQRLTRWSALLGILLALASLIYLALLPADADQGLIGKYSLARLLLMGGPALTLMLLAYLYYRMERDPVWCERVTRPLFTDARSIPRLVFAFVLTILVLLGFLTHSLPQFEKYLTGAYLLRLLPYLAAPAILLTILAIAWRFMRSDAQPDVLFFFLLGATLILTAWLGRLNPGGYLNVFMPGYLGLSVLLGLGLGNLLRWGENVHLTWKQAGGALILVLYGVQMVTLIPSIPEQLPTSEDRQAGMRLVETIASFEGEVYVPYHTYMAVLAGKSAYAGVVEMGELSGSFGGRPDPLWDEVTQQIHGALSECKFDAIIQDNQFYRPLLVPAYVETIHLFDDQTSFWPVTGRRVRPEVVFTPARQDSCR